MRLYYQMEKEEYDSVKAGGVVRIPFNAHWIKRLCYSAKTTIPADKCDISDRQKCRACFCASSDWVCYPFDSIQLRNGFRQSLWYVESVYFDAKSFCVKLKERFSETKTSISENGTERLSEKGT